MTSIHSILSPASEAASASQESAVDIGFSTAVAGKKYPAAVMYSSGEYIAEDPGLSEAVATGNSVADAEDHLATRLDALV